MYTQDCCSTGTLDPVYYFLALLFTVGLTVVVYSLVLLSLACLICTVFTTDRILLLAARGRRAFRL